MAPESASSRSDLLLAPSSPSPSSPHRSFTIAMSPITSIPLSSEERSPHLDFFVGISPYRRKGGVMVTMILLLRSPWRPPPSSPSSSSSCLFLRLLVSSLFRLPGSGRVVILPLLLLLPIPLAFGLVHSRPSALHVPPVG